MVYTDNNQNWKAGNIKMPAYDVAYLDSMIKKHRYLFKLIGRNCEGNAFAVIDRYLRGEYRKRMDETFAFNDRNCSKRVYERIIENR